MEINNCQNLICSALNQTKRVDEDIAIDNTANTRYAPSFKANWEGVLRKSGEAMNWIENGGFLVLFLIQDFLGMTVPRTFAGFLRDKEQTGQYNMQEGFEVFGREILTGPSMMAVAPISLWAASKCLGQSTSVNTELIKRYGNSLKEMVSGNDFNKQLLDNPKMFKTEFYRKNINNMLRGLYGKELSNIPENELQKSVDFIMKELEHYENIPKDAKLSRFMGKSKYRNQCLTNITNHINNIRFNISSDLDLLQKIKFGSESLKDVKAFDIKKAFEGMVKYSNDAITANKHLKNLDSALAESLKQKALGKRAIMNVAMIAATLGVLSVLPKIYAKSDTAPGARKNNQEKETNNSNKNVTFKGKNSLGFFEKLGKIVDKNKNEFVSSELEYNGHNFTNSLMAGLSIFGLLTPRLMRAYKRAQKDENGKKDFTELWEIIIRDVTSSLAVVFAVPMLTRACVTSYENKSGFVLMQKDRSKKGYKTVLDLFNPYSKAHVLSNAEISALYDNVNTKEKMVNFCKYIDNNGGDLKKILAKSESINELFNEKTKSFGEFAKLSKQEANKEIISFVENLETNIRKLGKSVDKKSVDQFVTKVMKSAAKGKNSKITAFARGLNSVPGLLTTFFISPYILGWFIPRLTYKNTRRIHEKHDREREQQKQNNLKIAV